MGIVSEPWGRGKGLPTARQLEAGRNRGWPRDGGGILPGRRGKSVAVCVVLPDSTSRRRSTSTWVPPYHITRQHKAIKTATSPIIDD